MKTGNNKKYFKLLTVILLGCAVVVTGAFAISATGLSAKYLGQGQTEDEARVAKFDIAETGTMLTKDVAISVVPGITSAEPLVITNSSEVAVRCMLKVKNETKNLCGPLTMALYEGETEIIPKEGSTSTEASYEFEFSPNEGTKGFEVRFLIPETGETEEPDPNLAYMGMVDHITVSVIAEQID